MYLSPGVVDMSPDGNLNASCNFQECSTCVRKLFVYIRLWTRTAETFTLCASQLFS